MACPALGFGDPSSALPSRPFRSRRLLKAPVACTGPVLPRRSPHHEVTEEPAASGGLWLGSTIMAGLRAPVRLVVVVVPQPHGVVK